MSIQFAPLILGLSMLMAITACESVNAPSIKTECSLSIEEHPTSEGLRLSIQTNDDHQCSLSESQYRRVLTDWWTERRPRPHSIDSIYLGRATKLPWLSEYMFKTSSIHLTSESNKTPWTGATGKANTFVEAILLHKEFRNRLGAPFHAMGYEIQSIEVEKVLLRSANGGLNGQQAQESVPYDALIGLGLKPRQ